MQSLLFLKTFNFLCKKFLIGHLSLFLVSLQFGNKNIMIDKYFIWMWNNHFVYNLLHLLYLYPRRMWNNHFVYSLLHLLYLYPRNEVWGYIGVTRLVGRSSGPYIFLVRSITWRLMVRIQYNFIQLSSTLIGSAVHKDHKSIFTNYRLIALCYSSIASFCPDHNLKTNGWNSL
jgi:hypothetical protein